MRFFAVALALLPGQALASDLGDAVAWIEDAVGEQAVHEYGSVSEAHDDGALPFLVSRDVQMGTPLDAYDCTGSPVDSKVVMRTSGEEMWALRYCMKARWNRDSLPGYKTLGDVRLHPRDVEQWVRVASRETQIAEDMLKTVIQYSSGYRPGVISEDGHYGLMQLKPENLREVGLSFGNLLDPRENILVGARYLQRLWLLYSDVKKAFAAYKQGPSYLAAHDGVIPQDTETVWFMRAMLVLYYGRIREVPPELAAESMAFVWNWLE